MGIRDFLNKNEKLSFGIVGAALVILVLVYLKERLGSSGIAGISSKAYFTTDDTLTGEAALDALFVDSVSNVPPFDHNGKPAYRAVVYNCNGGRTRWIQNLRRFTPKVRDQVVAAYAADAAKGITTDAYIQPFEPGGLEVKAPGPGPWVGMRDPSYIKIVTPAPPSGVPSNDLLDDVP